MSAMTKTWLMGALSLLAATVVHGAELASVTINKQLSAQERLFDGVVEAVHQSTVSAQLVGRITEINYDVDDFVAKDAVIVRFRDTEQRARFEQAKAGLQEAKARLKEANDELARVKDVYAKKLVAKADLDKAIAGQKAAAARVEAADAKLAEAQEQLAHTEIRAPFAGIVTQRHVEPGETVGVGQPLMTGFSYEHLRATVHIPQAFIGAVRDQSAASVVLADEQRLAAESIRIFPYADQRGHAFQVRVGLPQGDYGLYPGMFVKVAFVVSEAESLLVPESAVVNRSELTSVYVVEGGKVRLRQVRVGRHIGDQFEILAGLSDGEQVALDPIAAGIKLKQQH